MKGLRNFTVFAILSVLATVPAAFGQEEKAAQDSAAKMRQLVHQIYDQLSRKGVPIEKSFEEAWPLLLKVGQMFEGKPDSAAAIALGQAWVEAFEKQAEVTERDYSPLLRLGTLALMREVIYLCGDWRENFILSLLPVLEADRDDKVTKWASYHVVGIYLRDPPDVLPFSRINDWLKQRAKKGQIPPRCFIDTMFEVNPELALDRLLYVYSTEHDLRLSRRGGLLFSVTRPSVKYAVELKARSDEEMADAHREVEQAIEGARQRARRLLVQTWEACPQWYLRRYLLEYVRKNGNLLLSPELKKLMEKENHPALKPVITEILTP